MGFGLYSLILVGVLFTNSVAIINERFLKQCQPTAQHSAAQRSAARHTPQPHRPAGRG